MGARAEKSNEVLRPLDTAAVSDFWANNHSIGG